MILHNKEIDNRINVVLDKSIKDDTSTGIMTYGEHNDYPQIIEKLIYGSQTAKACAKIYSKFIGGDGFENPEIGMIEVGIDSKGKPITLDKIRREISQAIAFFNGFYIHTNLNIGGEVTSTRTVPFKNARFSREDSQGYCSRIAVSQNWTQKTNKKDITWFNTFNLKSEVLTSNIKNAGGIQKFKGQIYFGFLDDNYLYPLSPFDSVYLSLDTEYQIQIFKNREIRNGFTDKIIINMTLPEDEISQYEQYKEIQSFMGPDGDKALVIGSEFDENGDIRDKSYKIEKIDTNMNDKLFNEWESSLSNSIRKSINALPAVLIDYDQGGLSQASGEMIIQATSYYNALTRDTRSYIAECIKEIYSNHVNPVLKNNTNWNIVPTSILDSKSTNV